MGNIHNGHSRRQIHLDFLRFISIFAVVIIHVSAENWLDVAPSSLAWNAMNLYDGLSRWSVPVFLMISGALFLANDKALDLKRLWQKNILRIFIILVFWSFFYAVIYYGNSQNINTLIQQFVLGHFHLWFLYMLIGVYIISPLLCQIAKNEQLTRYFLLFWLIFSCIFPFIFNQTWGRFYIPLAASFINQFQIEMVVGYSGYFVLGYYLNKRNFPKKVRGIIYVLGITSAIFTVAANAILSIHRDSPQSYLYGNLTPNVFLTSVAMFVMGNSVLKEHSIKNETEKFIVKLSGCTLGIYTTHMIVMDVFKHAGFDSMTFNPFISIPLLATIIIFTSIALTLLIKKIPYLGKWII